MVMKWCTKFAGLIIGVIQVKKLQAICRPVFLSICLMENIMEVHDFSIFILHFLMENVMENFMEVHNFSIFILRFFSIFSPYSFPLYGEKAEMNMEKISAFSPLSSIKSGVSILPIIWRKSGNECGDDTYQTCSCEMILKTWSSILEVPSCFSRSSVKFICQKNRRFWPELSISRL